jgi:hypothetical protein
MENAISKITISLLFALLLAISSIAVGVTQNPQRPNRDNHLGGKLSAINGNTFSVTNREGETQTFTVTADTKYVRNGEAATLSSFQVNDFVSAEGAKDASGQFVATTVLGGDKPPRGPGGRGPRGNRDGIFGEYVSADASAGTVTIKTRDGKEQTVYTTSTTEVSRNRAAASLSDFKAGDHVGAIGALNADGKYIATRIMGGDAPPPPNGKP